MSVKITPFLMFDGRAEEAINYYQSIFDSLEIQNIIKYGKDHPGMEGKVLHALLSIDGNHVVAIDSAAKHEFTFTPSLSLFVGCNSEEEIDRVFNGLALEGSTLMPLGDYGFSKKFGWVNDKFGVSWQINLE